MQEGIYKKQVQNGKLMRKYTRNMRVTFHSITHIAEEKKHLMLSKLLQKMREYID
jgi:hypothetical protein